MDEKSKNYLSKTWRILNAVLAVIFAYLIVDAWIQVLYFKSAEKHY